jgi:hypothetical protein
MKILYIEDIAIAATLKLRLERKKYKVDIAPNLGRAWSWLEERKYEAIILDLAVGENADIYFKDEEDKKAILEDGEFSGYIFYKSIICKLFPEYKDKTLFITGYYPRFIKTFNNISEFNYLKNRIVDKRTFGFGDVVFDGLKRIEKEGAL